MIGFSEHKAVFGLLIALFLAANIGGAFATGMMEKGDMHGCPYMGVPVLCAMSPLEHLSGLQQRFAATVAYSSAVASLLLLVLAVFRQSLNNPLLPGRTRAGVPRYRERGRPLDPLRLALSRGIVHSKAY